MDSIPIPSRFKQALTKAVAYQELAKRTQEAVRSGRAQDFKRRMAHEQATAVTRARNRVHVACILAAPRLIVARPPVAARERRERRPRARRTAASRDGPGELDPPPAPSRRRLGGRS